MIKIWNLEGLSYNDYPVDPPPTDYMPAEPPYDEYDRISAN